MIPNIRALGRLKSGQMNKTEADYSAYLEILLRAGEIAWYRYEGIKFRLASNTFYSPDFAVMLPDGEMQIHEVKGYMMDDAAAKIKIAAEMFPFQFFIVRKEKSGWNVTKV